MDDVLTSNGGQLPSLDEGEMARKMRIFAAQRARDLGRPDLVDDVMLVVSELVTNAMLHGGGCTGVDVERTEDGLRVGVHDRSFAPPLVGRPGEGSLTGRGIHLVASLASRWGADPEDGGKVVWAELPGVGLRSGEAPSDSDLIARWAERTPGLEPRVAIDLGEVPTALLLSAKSHVDNLVREFALVAMGAKSGGTSDLPPELAERFTAMVEQFADARFAIKHEALEASRRGAVQTRLVLQLPVSAASAAENYRETLDEVDAYCRARRLLTLETPPQHRVFRHWYTDEVVTQLRAIASGIEPPPVHTLESRLLSELDRLAAAQRSSERAARLYAVTAAFAAAASPEAISEAVLTEGVVALGAAGGGVLLAAEGDTLFVPGVVGYDEDVVARLRSESRDAELPAAVALRTGEAVWLESREERDRRFPELAGLEARTVSLCAVPLEVQNRRLGALRFSFNEARLFDEDERRFVCALAAQTAQALERAQLQQARLEVSRRLQRGLLPPSLPAIPGLEVAAIYHPFGDGMDIGGDFYDMWAVEPNTWAFAIGDAAGTGPEAATLTALVRHTLRAVTMGQSDPVGALEKLNQALIANRADELTERFCTAMVGVVTIGDGVRVDFANGGHPYPLVRRSDGSIEEIAMPGTLLGMFSDAVVGQGTVELGPGDAVLMFTDGSSEARRGAAFFGVEGVKRVLTSVPRGAKATVEALERAVLAYCGGSSGDDLAAVALYVIPI